jgi:hypothetical protein
MAGDDRRDRGTLLSVINRPGTLLIQQEVFVVELSKGLALLLKNAISARQKFRTVRLPDFYVELHGWVARVRRHIADRGPHLFTDMAIIGETKGYNFLPPESVSAASELHK